jgi:hypothetical protein
VPLDASVGLANTGHITILVDENVMSRENMTSKVLTCMRLFSFGINMGIRGDLADNNDLNLIGELRNLVTPNSVSHFRDVPRDWTPSQQTL